MMSICVEPLSTRPCLARICKSKALALTIYIQCHIYCPYAKLPGLIFSPYMAWFCMPGYAYVCRRWPKSILVWHRLTIALPWHLPHKYIPSVCVRVCVCVCVCVLLWVECMGFASWFAWYLRFCWSSIVYWSSVGEIPLISTLLSSHTYIRTVFTEYVTECQCIVLQLKGSQVQSLPLKSRLRPLESRLRPLKSRLHPLKSRLRPLKSQLRPLKSRLRPLESRLHPLKSRLLLQKSRLQNLRCVCVCVVCVCVHVFVVFVSIKIMSVES